MKVTFLTFLVLILTCSCNNIENEELNSRITELENLNKTLTDSLNKIEFDRIINSQLIALPYEKNIIPNKPNKLNYWFHSNIDFPKYNVYRITKNGNEDVKEMIYENYNKSSFDFEFIPKTNKESRIELLIEFNLNGKKVKIPSVTYIESVE